MSSRITTVAAAHVAPVWMDPDRTVDKAIALMQEARRDGASFIVFPESFISGFPVWTAIAAPIVTHDLFQKMASAAIRIDGPQIERLRSAARRLGIIVQMGFTEGTSVSVGCFWNSIVLIGDDGSVLNHHRKLVPTYYEKLVWAPGDASGLRVCETSIGRIGGLICGENTNPLARYALMAQGEQIHTACFPPIWPTRVPGDGVGYDIEEAIRIRCGAHSFEAKCFTIVASGVLDETAIGAMSHLAPDAERILRDTPRAVSLVLGPDGRVIGTPLRDEGILLAQIDLDACVEQKQFQDVVGYYNRFDIFKLSVDRSQRRPVTFFGDIAAQDSAQDDVSWSALDERAG